MGLHSLSVVFALALLWPLNIYATGHNIKSDIDHLTDKCMRYRYHDLGNADITIDDVTTFCASQAIKTIDKSTQKSHLSEDAVLYILELYRKVLQRKTGSNDLHPSNRREVRTLTRSSWNSFVSRLNFLKTSMISRNLSRYDALSEMYTNLAVNSPSFLIQHRVFLLLAEEALGTSIPYWDVRIDQNMTNPTTCNMWTQEYFGSGFGKVVNGPFANWVSRDGPPLTRDIGNIGWLLSQDHFDQIMSLGSHHDILEPNRYPLNSLEFLGTGTKLWVKGWSNPLSSDPLDPVFIMIDAFIDYVWDMFWEKLQLNGIDPRNDYQSLNNLILDVFETSVLYNHKDRYDHSFLCKTCGRNFKKLCVGDKCKSTDNLPQPVYKMESLQALDAGSGKNEKHFGANYRVKTHHHRVKRNTQNVLDWGAIYDFFNRVREPRPVRSNRLTGPQRARAAIQAFGPLPIGRRFTSPFTDPRTRGDPLPTAPLRRRLKRGFYPMIIHRGIGRVGNYIRRFGPANVGPKFKSILTDIRTRGDVTKMSTKTLNPQKNGNKHAGINDYQIKHRFGPANVGPKFKSILTDIRTRGDPTHMSTKDLNPQKNGSKHAGINDYQIKHRIPQEK
ncbi:uncharacterized protein LOC110463637 [Mizuhopecten yessoensis]|uniref:Tyrosinase-like protein 1 n=1 Tax=Mizuhopecten yessoensis TaxID=6573 RepID=A0A210R2D2_MIZYE|nr:uncharacterized protein LOC110463637 [Mizuhopecten yessoensis]XP_021374106.1 uncharacterized protein LOC110463637 [Mizuhopecten yessoensis]OWF55159.1 Tyrosinase-like protein 1 [Mizuhopecten yessoensis]